MAGIGEKQAGGIGMSRPKNQTTDVEALEKWEYHLILTRLAPHWRLFYELLWETGLRLGEALAIERDDLENTGVWVVSSKRQDHLRVHTPLSPALFARLRIQALSLKGPRLFPFTSSAAWLALKKAASVSGVRKTIHPHLFRHGFGRRVTHADMGGKSALEQLTIAKEMLRHVSIRSTERYIRPSKSDIADAFRELNK